MDITSFNQIITSRRSVLPKDFEAGKIDDQIIWQILKNANWAPTHKMTAPWRFKVYSGKGLEFLGKKLIDSKKLGPGGGTQQHPATHVVHSISQSECKI